MRTTKRGKALSIPGIEGPYKLYTLKARSPYEEKLKNLNIDSNCLPKFRKKKLSMDKYDYLIRDPNGPKVGDIIGCSDGDVGVVVSPHMRYSDISDDSFMVEVSWSSGKTLTDPWSSKDFSSSKNMFWIMSRA